MPINDVLLYIGAFAIIFFAYFIRGVTGFGSGLLAIPALAIFMPIKFVLPFIGMLDFFASFGQSMHHRSKVQWNEILILIPFSLIGMAFGFQLLSEVDNLSLNYWLGIFIILYAFYSLFHQPIIRIPGRRASPLAILGGIVDVIFGIGGPFYIIYLRMRQWDKTQFVASIAMIFMLLLLIRMIAYLFHGYFDLTIAMFVISALPLVFLAMYLGNRVHLSIPAERFTQLIAILLFISGLVLINRT